MTKLITYKSDTFIGKEIQIDEDFITSLKLIEDYARFNDLQLYITQAVRNANVEVGGAIVTPATKSNHLVGHAIDMNIQWNGSLFNSDDLKPDNLVNLPSRVNSFIKGICSNKCLRWGGDFNPADPVHIDDGLNIYNPDLWEEKYRIIQALLNPRTLFLTNPIMQGNDVSELQLALINKGYTINVDKQFGEETDKIVRAFQQSNNLTVDGIVGDATKKLLGLL